MAPAPPRNEPSDWLVPQRPCRVRRPCPARLRRARKSAESLQLGGGVASAGSWKARETLLPAGRSGAGGRGGAPPWAPPPSPCQYPSSSRLSGLGLSPASVGGPPPSPISRPRPRHVVPGPLPLGSAFRPALAGRRGPGPAPFSGEGGLARRLPVPGGAGLHFPAGGRRHGCGQVTGPPDPH